MHHPSYHLVAPALATPLPKRSAIRLPDGTFISSPWTTLSALQALNAGGWFSPTIPYEFSDRITAAYCHRADEFFRTLRETLNPSEPQA